MSEVIGEAESLLVPPADGVVCSTCGDEVGAPASCPTCGAPLRGASGGTSADRPEEALLDRVSEALAAQANLTPKPTPEHDPPPGGRPAETSVLERRLRRQARLLRNLTAEHEELQARLIDSLARVERALEALDNPRTGPPGPLVDVQLPRSPTCTELARRRLQEHVVGLLDEQTASDGVLIASELVNNAFVHGRGQITLRAYVIEQRLRIEVADEGQPTWIGVRAQVDGGTGGWGLWIVEHLSVAWGAEEHSALVWADLPLPA